jgi:DNA (cytosine-5)-methyltransferase 1
MKRMLDLYCCQGGASEGYRRAGFDVYGSDIDQQPHYPFAFHQGDALWVLRTLLTGRSITLRSGSTFPRALTLADFDAIHASPPCQRRTKAQKIQKNEHPALIAPTRELLIETGLPYVIENVVPDDDELDDDPLVAPIVLCGEMFGLETYRHRQFETNWRLDQPAHPTHVARNTKMGRRPVDGEYMHIVGNFSGVDKARRIMDMPWATRDGLREAIPPAYSEYVGAQMLAALALEDLERAA